MTDEELKNKCTERAKIFQQAMESCHSSNPMDCIEWFADRIAELEKENAELKEHIKADCIDCTDYYKNKRLEKENTELKDYRLTTLAKQQTGMSKYALNLEHKLSWYDDQLTKAKELLNQFLEHYKAKTIYVENMSSLLADAENFLKESEVEK